MYILHKIAYFLRGILLSALLRFHGAKVGRRLRVERNVRFRYRLHKDITIGDDVYIGANGTFDVPPGCRLHIGHRASLNVGVFVGGNTAIYIGSDVLVGEYASIRDAGHGIDDPDMPINRQPMVSKPVRIANNVWLGRGVCILPGAVVGEGSVIGANAVVHGEIAPGAVAVGIPAKTIRTRGRTRGAAPLEVPVSDSEQAPG